VQPQCLKDERDCDKLHHVRGVFKRCAACSLEVSTMMSVYDVATCVLGGIFVSDDELQNGKDGFFVLMDRASFAHPQGMGKGVGRGAERLIPSHEPSTASMTTF
jgi:hypothetical protein